MITLIMSVICLLGTSAQQPAIPAVPPPAPPVAPKPVPPGQPPVNPPDSKPPAPNDDLEYIDLNRLNNGNKKPFRVCGFSKGSDIYQLEKPRACPQYDPQKNHVLGVGVLFKDNLEPYIFNVRTYSKEVISITSWSSASQRTITNREVARYPVSLQEATTKVDPSYMCSNRVSVKRHGTTVDIYHHNQNEQTLPLEPSNIVTEKTSKYVTLKTESATWGSWWIYRTVQNVNCILTTTQAKSRYPYEFFALSTGEVIEMSPFFYKGLDLKQEIVNEDLSKLSTKKNYAITDYANRAHKKIYQTYNFLEKPDYLVSWEVKEKKDAHCLLKKWKTVPYMIKSDQSKNFHFLARELTSTFISPKEELNITHLVTHNCVTKDAEAEIKKKFDDQEFAASYTKVGNIQYYKVTGNMILAFQQVKEMSLQEAMTAVATTASPPITPNKPSRRRRRDAKPGNIPFLNTTSEIGFIQLQYAYNKIQDYTNTMLSRIAEAWCEMQNRDITVWSELTKINPSSVVSTLMGKTVSAKKLGDVLAVSECLQIDPKNVIVVTSMKVPGTNGELCYSRPPLRFKYGNGEMNGQLGFDNEILPGLTYTENCDQDTKHYFLFGDAYLLYQNYIFVKYVYNEDILTMSSFVDLNITLLEDVDFNALEIYTRDEISRANVFDIESMFREYNMHRQAVYTIQQKPSTRDEGLQSFLKGVGEFFVGMGKVGTAIAGAIGAVAGGLASFMSGIADFISNPFGGLLIFVIVIVVVIIAFLAYRGYTKMKRDPVRAMFPMVPPIPKDQPIESLSEQEEQEMEQLVNRMQRYSANHRQQVRNTPSALRQRITNLLNKKKDSGKYELLQMNTHESEA